MDNKIKDKIRQLAINPADDLYIAIRPLSGSKASILIYSVTLSLDKLDDNDCKFRDFKQTLLRASGVLPGSNETVTTLDEFVSFCYEVVLPHLFLAPKAYVENEQGEVEKTSLFGDQETQTRIVETFKGEREDKFWKELTECFVEEFQDTTVFKERDLGKIFQNPNATKFGVNFNLELSYEKPIPPDEFFDAKNKLVLVSPDGFRLSSCILFTEEDMLKEMVFY